MRTVIITGATSGFGNLLVKEFLKNGDRVIATGRKISDRSEIFSDERLIYGIRLIEKNLDVTSELERIELVTFLEQNKIKVDILINNAGYGLFGAFEDISIDQVRHQFEVNVFGLMALTQNLLPLLIESKAKIFNFSSVFGFFGFPLTSIYCSSKFAIEGLTEALSYELRPLGVQVCLIEPGGFKTRFTNSSVWGFRNLPRYQKETRNYLNLRDKMMNRKSTQDPKYLAEGLYKFSLKRKLPLRKRFGKDAFITWLFTRMIPRDIVYSSMHFFYRFLFQK